MKKKKILFICIGAVVGVLLLLFLFAELVMFSLGLGGGRRGSESTAGTGNSEQESTVKVDYENAYKGSCVPDVLTDEVLADYLKNMAPADDEYDFRYATDFAEFDLVKLYKGRDSSAYEKIIGYKDATLEQIRQAIDANDNIAPKYKDFVYQFACDLRTLYPNCNLAVFYHNLQTLIIDEMTQTEIDMETLSTNSAACYLRYENRVCIAEGLDLSRER